MIGHKSTASLSHYIHKASESKKRKMADILSSAFSEGPITSASGSSTSFRHPAQAVHPIAAAATIVVVAASSDVIAPGRDSRRGCKL